MPIALTANAVEANTVYHQALAQAVDDGVLKAGILATQAHAKLGPVEAISEGHVSTTCKNAAGEYGSYKGAEPDNGNVEGPVVALALPTAPALPAQPSKAKKPGGSHKKTRMASHDHCPQGRTVSPADLRTHQPAHADLRARAVIADWRSERQTDAGYGGAVEILALKPTPGSADPLLRCACAPR